MVAMTNELPGESRPSPRESLVLTPALSRPRFAVAPSSGVIHTPSVSAVSFTPLLIFHLDSRAPHVSFRLLPDQLLSRLRRSGISSIRGAGPPACWRLASITVAVRSMQARWQPDGLHVSRRRFDVLRTSLVRLVCWIFCGSMATTHSTDRL